MGLMGKSSIPNTGDTQVLHFTQLVWKGTTKIGCAVNYCGTDGALFGSDFYAYTTVCNYASAGKSISQLLIHGNHTNRTLLGNVDGGYASNVS